MTPLRQRFIDDMRLRNLSPQTIEAYVLAVKKFSKHFGKSPEVLGPDDIRRYQLHLIDRQASWSQFNQGVCALRFLPSASETLVIEPVRERCCAKCGSKRLERVALPRAACNSS